jgi:DNA-binding response OmpR family regulator
MYKLAIVDDNETWCFVLALRLQQQGYAVSTFTDVEAFLPEVARFDLALVDFSLPVPRHQRATDGTEVISQVKRQSDNPPLLVLMSSFFPADWIDEVADICPEADAVLPKQTEIEEMFFQIHQLLASRRSLTSQKSKVKSHR